MEKVQPIMVGDPIDDQDSVANPKDLLDHDIPVEIGSFATLDDDSPLKLFIVTAIKGSIATLGELELTEAKDDMYLGLTDVPLSEVLAVDDSFVNVNGVLWNIRKKLIKKDVK